MTSEEQFCRFYMLMGGGLFWYFILIFMLKDICKDLENFDWFLISPMAISFVPMGVAYFKFGENLIMETLLILIILVLGTLLVLGKSINLNLFRKSNTEMKVDAILKYLKLRFRVIPEHGEVFSDEKDANN